MSDHEMKRLDGELYNFTSRNFEKPTDCRDLEQTRFYVKELCEKISEYERKFNYVPDWAYLLLAQYNNVQNTMIHRVFVTAYGQEAA